MARNVHKTDVRLKQLPQEAIREDRGLRTCGTPQLVLASTSDVVSYKNDRTAIAFKFDSMTIELESSDGTLTAATGVSVSFPNQSDAIGYVIDWRQLIDSSGDLKQGCYKVKVNWTLAGNTGYFYYGAYQLLEYSTFNARGTTRLYVVLNDFVRKQGINYKDSGFAGTVRFKGIFGFMQPNYDIENNTHTNRERYKIRNEALRTYELRTDYLLECQTRLIDEQTLLVANQIYVTDHNAGNHNQSIYDFPVILDENESPSFEYPTGSVYAKITAKFVDKVAHYESKYNGNIQGSENVILDLPSTVSSCSPATITLDSAPLATVASGASFNAQLVDQNGLTITPTSISSGVIEVNQPQGTTAQLMKTGDPNDGAAGRNFDALTLDSVPLDISGNIFLANNTDRFCDELGTQVYAGGIVVDRATFEPLTGKVLCYPINITLTGNVTRSAAESACSSYSTGSFTSGWRLWNNNERANMIIFGGTSHFWFAPWNNTTAFQYWTLTKVNAASTVGFVSSGTYGNVTQALLIGASGRALPVRTAVWNGSALT